VAAVLLSWSSGKDSAWALQVLRREGAEVAALLTTFDAATARVPLQEVPLELVRRQAQAVGLPLWTVALPQPCPNAEYERSMRRVLQRAAAEGVSEVAFGDLYLEDIRHYRQEMMRPTRLSARFPLWCRPDETARLAEEMIAAGVEATVSCVDRALVDPGLAGRRFDLQLLAQLPPGVDPLGERGEFHTFCHWAPGFSRRVDARVTGFEAGNGRRWALLSAT
jgi:uncharacterized protein (TIGR00290 family)